MTRNTHIALFLMGELFAALRANDPDLFKRWPSGGIQDLGEPVVEELLLVSIRSWRLKSRTGSWVGSWV